MFNVPITWSPNWRESLGICCDFWYIPFLFCTASFTFPVPFLLYCLNATLQCAGQVCAYTPQFRTRDRKSQFPVLPCASWRLNSGCQAWRQASTCRAISLTVLFLLFFSFSFLIQRFRLVTIYFVSAIFMACHPPGCTLAFFGYPRHDSLSPLLVYRFIGLFFFF